MYLNASGSETEMATSTRDSTNCLMRRSSISSSVTTDRELMAEIKLAFTSYFAERIDGIRLGLLESGLCQF